MRALLSLFAGNFATGTGAFLVASVVVAVAADLSITIEQAGQLMTVYAITSAVASPLLVAWTARIDRRTLLALSLGGVSLANLLSALSPSFFILLVSRLLSALAAAVFTPMATSVGAALSPPERRGQAIALLFAGFSAAMVAGIPFTAWLATAYGWRSAFGAVALAAAVVLVIVYAAIPSGLPHRVTPVSSWTSLFADRWLMIALVATITHMTAQFVLYPFIVPLLQWKAGLQIQQGSLVLLVFGAASLVGSFVGGRIADRLGCRAASLLGLTGMLASYIALNLVNVAVMVWLLVAVWAFFSFMFQPSQQTRLLQLAPSSGSVVLAFNAALMNLGMGVGTGIGGAALRAFGPAGLIWAAVASAAVAVCVFLLGTTAESRRPVKAGVLL